MNRFFRSALFPLIIIVVLAYLAMNTLTRQRREGARRPPTRELIARIQDNPESIEQVVFDPRKQQITADAHRERRAKIVVNYPTRRVAVRLRGQLRAQGRQVRLEGHGRLAGGARC